MEENVRIVLEYLEEAYAAAVECCGEDDEINTLPCKSALEAARKIAKDVAMIS